MLPNRIILNSKSASSDVNFYVFLSSELKYRCRETFKFRLNKPYLANDNC